MSKKKKKKNNFLEISSIFDGNTLTPSKSIVNKKSII